MAEKALLSFIFTFLLICGIQCSSFPVCTNIQHFDHLIENNRALQSTFKTFENFGLLRCVQQCLFRARCHSINFDMSTRFCELNQPSDDARIIKHGSVYTEVARWPTNLALLCENHICDAVSVCVSQTDSYICIKDDISPLMKGYTKALNLSFYYKVYEEERTYAEAKNICSEEGARLIEPDTPEKDNYIINITEDLGLGNVFFGATNIEDKTTWRWNSNNATFTYTHWGSNEPNNWYQNEWCASFYKRKKHLWNDYPCSYKCMFICEIVIS